MGRKELRERLIKKTNGKCGYCGCDLHLTGHQWRKWQVDHILPKQKGGTNDEGNLMPSCPSCNRYKQVATLEEFRRIVKHTLLVLNRNSTAYRVARRFGLVEECDNPVVFYFETLNHIDKEQTN